MSRVRDLSPKRSAEVARTVASHSYGSAGPVAGQVEIEHNTFTGRVYARARIRGRVYTGGGSDETEARVSLFAEAAGLLGALSSDLQDEFYQDADEFVGRSF